MSDPNTHSKNPETSSEGVDPDMLTDDQRDERDEEEEADHLLHDNDLPDPPIEP